MARAAARLTAAELRCGHQHQLRSSARCAGSRLSWRHRRPCLRGGAGARGAAGRGSGRGLDGRGCAARHEARAGPWAVGRRQSFRPARRDRNARAAGSLGFPAVSALGRAAGGDDGACGVHGLRRPSAGEHIATGDSRGDPRRDRLRRAAHERRSRHEGARAPQPSGRPQCWLPARMWCWRAMAALPRAKRGGCRAGARRRTCPLSSAPVPFCGNSSRSTSPRRRPALPRFCAPPPESV